MFRESTQELLVVILPDWSWAGHWLSNLDSLSKCQGGCAELERVIPGNFVGLGIQRRGRAAAAEMAQLFYVTCRVCGLWKPLLLCFSVSPDTHSSLSCLLPRLRDHQRKTPEIPLPSTGQTLLHLLLLLAFWTALKEELPSSKKDINVWCKSTLIFVIFSFHF